MATTHPCPGGCGADVPDHQVACKPDWARLPKPLRDEIDAAYTRRRADSLRHARAVSQALRWYRANPAETAP
jgi:hypothetical protein